MRSKERDTFRGKMARFTSHFSCSPVRNDLVCMFCYEEALVFVLLRFSSPATFYHLLRNDRPTLPPFFFLPFFFLLHTYPLEKHLFFLLVSIVFYSNSSPTFFSHDSKKKRRQGISLARIGHRLFCLPTFGWTKRRHPTFI